MSIVFCETLDICVLFLQGCLHLYFQPHPAVCVGHVLLEQVGSTLPNTVVLPWHLHAQRSCPGFLL